MLEFVFKSIDWDRTFGSEDLFMFIFMFFLNNFFYLRFNRFNFYLLFFLLNLFFFLKLVIFPFFLQLFLIKQYSPLISININLFFPDIHQNLISEIKS